MEELNHIEDTQLPIELDYIGLKESGLAYIQKHSGNQWTNLNPSDPGVTILDQLCYAFTELGYCASFPIKDILTNSDGSLEIENQFFLPEDILTTSPITIQDYSKYIVDKVTGVKNCYFKSPSTTLKTAHNWYQIYLSLDPKINTLPEKDAICEEVFFVLNGVRNVGEFFMLPKPLQSIGYTVFGKLEIEDGYYLNNILTKINYEINNYVFPEIVQRGYDKLRDDGVSVNAIFNGPKLKKGWVDNATIGTKKNLIEAFEIQKVIQNIEGVISITGLYFVQEDTSKGDLEIQEPLYSISSDFNEIILLDFIESITSSFTIFSKGRQLNQTINSDFINEISSLKLPSAQIETVASIKMGPECPKGKYRDISNYYSIQNTFPEIYAVGADALEANASEFQIAQSRQLKGYLTLFDQVLSNQFAQLANISTLFSFKNPMTGTPIEEKAFYESNYHLNREHSRYPVPFKNFSATYFYQSLYDTVPYLRPLLKNNNAHNYSYGSKSAKVLENESWKEYKHDPYNAYIHGLMLFMEDEEVNLDRRNKILNHLLARHGESPLIIDNIISIHAYTANPRKNQVIIKSLLLQNYESLSYYRSKGYDYLGASQLVYNEENVTPAFREKLLEGYENDFIFDTDAIDRDKYIQPIDFRNYATVELKLNLLFAIDNYYHNYLIKHDNKAALWLLKKRKGFLFIETDLLKHTLTYELILRETISENEVIYTTVKQKISYQQILEIDQLISQFQAETDTLKEEIENGIGLSLTFESTKDANINPDFFQSIGDTPYAFAVIARIDENTILSINDPLFDDTVVLIFPTMFFGPKKKKNEWEKRKTHFDNKLQLFLENELPIHITALGIYKELSEIEEIIPLYIAWYNSLIYDKDNTVIDSLAATQPLPKSIDEFVGKIIKYITSND